MDKVQKLDLILIYFFQCMELAFVDRGGTYRFDFVEKKSPDLCIMRAGDQNIVCWVRPTLERA